MITKEYLAVILENWEADGGRISLCTWIDFKLPARGLFKTAVVKDEDLTVREFIRTLFAKWDKFSGDFSYPIALNGYELDDAYCDFFCGNMSAEDDMKYLSLRVDLCKFLIKELRK